MISNSLADSEFETSDFSTLIATLRLFFVSKAEYILPVILVSQQLTERALTYHFSFSEPWILFDLHLHKGFEAFLEQKNY
jgi:hypothetical protein